jgi:hypothetical protein
MLHGQQNIKLFQDVGQHNSKPLPDNTPHFQKTDTQTPEGFERAIPAGERRQTARQPRSAIS